MFYTKPQNRRERKRQEQLYELSKFSKNKKYKQRSKKLNRKQRRALERCSQNLERKIITQPKQQNELLLSVQQFLDLYKHSNKNAAPNKIYKITVNNEIYVGQTANLEARKQSHFEAAFKDKCDYKLYRAIRDAGWENVKFEVLHDNVQSFHMNFIEALEISRHNSVANGLNVKYGGDFDGRGSNNKIQHDGLIYKIKRKHNKIKYIMVTQPINKLN
jgi:hypothetical protein